MTHLEAALERVPWLRGRGTPERLAGLTNLNYRIGEHVLRISGAGTSEYISRSDEEVAAALLHRPSELAVGQEYLDRPVHLFVEVEHPPVGQVAPVRLEQVGQAVDVVARLLDLRRLPQAQPDRPERFEVRPDRVGVGPPLAAARQERLDARQARAEELGGAGGPYALQAAIAACHARAQTAEQTDWRRIAVLYYALSQRAPSPVVELNRAVAVAMAFGPAEGLAIVDALLSEATLRNYHLLPSVRGDLLSKLGRFEEARKEFERAASLTRNARERELLQERAAACSKSAKN